MPEPGRVIDHGDYHVGDQVPYWIIRPIDNSKATFLKNCRGIEVDGMMWFLTLSMEGETILIQGQCNVQSPFTIVKGVEICRPKKDAGNG